MSERTLPVVHSVRPSASGSLGRSWARTVGVAPAARAWVTASASAFNIGYGLEVSPPGGFTSK